MSVRFVGDAHATLRDLSPTVRSEIEREALRVAFGPRALRSHLHVEGYCLGYGYGDDGELRVFSLSVRCAPSEPEQAIAV